MRKLLSFLSLLLVLISPLAAYSQSGAGTKAAKAPARKPVSKAAATTTTPAKPVAKPATQNTAATGRSNSDRLPNSVPTTTPPPVQSRPTPPRQQYVSNQSPIHTSTPGALAYHQGDNLLNIGVGLSSYYTGNPIGASFEAGVDKDISVGAQFDYNSGNYYDGYYYSSRWGYRAMYLGVRGSYHFNRVFRLNTSKVDLYAGLGLGYRSFRWNDGSYGYGYDYASGLALNGFIGGRFYFSNRVGAFLEAGYTGLSSARVGLAVKF